MSRRFLLSSVVAASILPTGVAQSSLILPDRQFTFAVSESERSELIHALNTVFRDNGFRPVITLRDNRIRAAFDSADGTEVQVGGDWNCVRLDIYTSVAKKDTLAADEAASQIRDLLISALDAVFPGRVKFFQAGRSRANQCQVAL